MVVAYVFNCDAFLHLLSADGTRCQCDNHTGNNGNLGVLSNPLSRYADPANHGQVELHLALFTWGGTNGISQGSLLMYRAF